VALTPQPVLTAMALRSEELQSQMCRNEIVLGQASTMIVPCASPQGGAFEKDARWARGI
jgi:hypothetical protein